MDDLGVIRVAFVSNSARGEYTGRLKWAERLRARGFDVTFVLPYGEDDYSERITRRGIPVVKYRMDRRSLLPVENARTVGELLGIFRAGGFSIVHTFGHKANISGVLAARAAGVPAIFMHVTGLGEAFTPGGGLERQIQRLVLGGLYLVVGRFATAAFFQNQDDLDEFDFLVAEKRILAGGTGVDIREFARSAVSVEQVAALRRELKVDEDRLVVTYIGRLLPEKGIPELLGAVRMLAARNPMLVCLIVGPVDRADVHSLGAQEDDLQDGGCIRFLGRRDDVREILSITDVFVNPSYYREGVPRNNLEAMAMGCPVITADTPGCRDTVKDGDGGFLVPPRDVGALSLSLNRLLESSELRRRMGLVARRRAEEEFSVETSVGRVEAAYCAVMGDLRPTSIRDTKSQVQVGPMAAWDTARVVDIHLAAFPQFFLSFLGSRFLTLFYGETVALGELALVARDGFRVVGFVMGSVQPGDFFARLLRRRGIRFALAAMPALVRRPRAVPRLVRAIRKPRQAARPQGTATLLSLGVDPDWQGRGVGRALVEAFVAEAGRRGAIRVDLTTDGAGNEQAKAFYWALGFTLAHQITTSEGRVLNEYVFDFPVAPIQ